MTTDASAVRRRLELVDQIERRLLAVRTDEQKEAAAELERQLAMLLRELVASE